MSERARHICYNRTMKKANLLWVDLEMTGLDPQNDKIVEVGAIATGWDFATLATYESTVKLDQDFLRKKLVGEFWDKNDASRKSLLKNNEKAQLTSAEVEQKLCSFARENFDLTQPIYLAGNSVHQDQKFIENEWTELNKLLHYRQLDVSSWKIVMNARGVVFAKPEDHRAMADIEGSIAELKYYLQYFSRKKVSSAKESGEEE